MRRIRPQHSFEFWIVAVLVIILVFLGTGYWPIAQPPTWRTSWFSVWVSLPLDDYHQPGCRLTIISQESSLQHLVFPGGQTRRQQLLRFQTLTNNNLLTSSFACVVPYVEADNGSRGGQRCPTSNHTTNGTVSDLSLAWNCIRSIPDLELHQIYPWPEGHQIYPWPGGHQIYPWPGTASDLSLARRASCLMWAGSGPDLFQCQLLGVYYMHASCVTSRGQKTMTGVGA